MQGVWLWLWLWASLWALIWLLLSESLAAAVILEGNLMVGIVFEFVWYLVDWGKCTILSEVSWEEDKRKETEKTGRRRQKFQKNDAFIMCIHTPLVLYRQQPLIDACRRSSSTTTNRQWRVESDNNRLFRNLFPGTLCRLFSPSKFFVWAFVYWGWGWGCGLGWGGVFI